MTCLIYHKIPVLCSSALSAAVADATSDRAASCIDGDSDDDLSTDAQSGSYTFDNRYH